MTGLRHFLDITGDLRQDPRYHGKPHPFLTTLERYTETFLYFSKPFLPHIARVLLISTFLEDSWRMWFRWAEQRDHMEIVWECGYTAANLFVLFNLVGQLVPCLMILARRKVTAACVWLCGMIAVQNVMYPVFWDLQLFTRSLALAGGLVLLMAEDHSEQAKAGILPGATTGQRTNFTNYLQLTGRVLLAAMFTSLLYEETDEMNVTQIIVESSLMFLIIVGYKTKLTALVLSVWLGLQNFKLNPFWTEHHDADVMRCEFFQTLGVIGGLLIIVNAGAGEISVDVKQKAR